MVAWLIFCGRALSGQPHEGSAPDRPATAWRHTKDGWIPSHLLFHEVRQRQITPPTGVHPISVATFQVVACMVALLGSRRLGLEGPAADGRE